MSQVYLPPLSVSNSLRSKDTILQSIDGEGLWRPEVRNNLLRVWFFIEITSITHTTEFDDDNRAEIK
jgi:hypothetical protein